MNALAALLGLVVGAGVMLLWSGLRPYGRVDAMPAALPFAGQIGRAHV